MLCSDDVAKSIGDFIEEYDITKIVLGEAPGAVDKEIQKASEFGRIEKTLKKHGVEIIIVKREEN